MLKPIHVSESVRQTMCAVTTATINGNPARISGWRNEFATVTDLNTRMSCEFAWTTAFGILSTHKKFKS